MSDAVARGIADGEHAAAAIMVLWVLDDRGPLIDYMARLKANNPAAWLYAVGYIAGCVKGWYG
jgi:hypothetical protein